MNRELLEMPFQPEQIKHRKGNFGNTLAYLEAHAVIQRLNDALDGSWSFEIVSHDILQDEVLVLGRLTSGTVCKTQFGNSSITRNKTTGDAISLGDDLKAAATDALKKAATLLGVGNYLYAGNGQGPHATERAHVNGSNGNTLHSNVTRHPQRKYFDNSNEQNHVTNRISSKQLAYLHRIAKDKAITRQELNDLAIQRFNTKVDFLSKKDASLFIDGLISNSQTRQHPQNAA